MEIMPVLFCDNGKEFSNPKAIEHDCQENQCTHIFYFDSSSSYQKGSAENHEFIRYFVPKGKSFDLYTQDDINRMMNNINSYCRKSLGNKCLYDVFSFFMVNIS